MQKRTRKLVQGALRQGRGSQQGFTLVEMLIAIAASLILMAGVTQVFIAHSRHYSQQDDVAVMQQNLRGVLMLMPAEMRLAGCDPEETGEANIVSAKPDHFEFQADIGRPGKTKKNEGDGKIDASNEQIAYTFKQDEKTLCRKAMSSTGKFDDPSITCQPLAENIDKLEFSYVLEDGTVKLEPKRNELNKIRAVQISILARAENPVPGKGHLHAGKFVTAAGTEWKTDASEAENKVEQDSHRRRMVVTTIQLRNRAY